jgi:Lanthionine-containing peptide SapB precursor RamS
MALLDLQDLELDEASRDPFMASNSDGGGTSSLSLLLC